MEISASNEWYNIVEDLKKEKGIALIIGATDTGKSTLAKFLITKLCEQGLRVSLVDADIGQSFLGPPTTIGFLTFESPINWESIKSADIFFVGSTSPENHFNVHLTGVKRMVDKAVSRRSEIILIDTTGYISGEGGKELKRRKIDLISPKYIISIERKDELDGILGLYKDNPNYLIYRISPSEKVKIRSMEERRRYRAKLFQDYFYNSSIQEIDTNKLDIEGKVLSSKGFSIPISWALQTEGLLIGLKDNDDETIGLAIIKECFEDKGILKILTPIKKIIGVKKIQLGSIILNSNFEEVKI